MKRLLVFAGLLALATTAALVCSLQSANGSTPQIPKNIGGVVPVIGKQVALRRDFYQRNQVPVVHGQASFVDPHTIEVDTGMSCDPRPACSVVRMPCISPLMVGRATMISRYWPNLLVTR